MSYSRHVRHSVMAASTIALLVALALPGSAQAGRAEGAISKMDRNGDGMLSRKEWKKKKLFKRFDADGNGQITLQELRDQFGESGAAVDAAPTPENGAEHSDKPDPKTISAIRRSKPRGDDIRNAIERGLFETGLRPTWPTNVQCPDLDHWFAMDYQEYRGKDTYHGGIDIPVPYNVPVRAVMDGEVIAKFMGYQTPRGIELVLRHTPDDSGLPYFIYTRYTHFKTLPTLKIGQRVKMGDDLGPTGNTGTTRCQVCRNQRRSLLHLDILYTKNPNYFANDRIVIPFDARWMDPVALFRKQPPFESSVMKALPDADKRVTVSYRLQDGSVHPADTRMIWPYDCKSVDHPAGSRRQQPADDGVSSVLDL